MKYYLSSYRIGQHGDKLIDLSNGGPLAYIPNALDHIPAKEHSENKKRNIQDLLDIGVKAELLDLKDFFGALNKLQEVLSKFNGVWVTGGNTFVLRQAMRLSGFDEIINLFQDSSFLYGGYSAGICVLAPNLDGIRVVDDHKQFPYPEIKEPIWEGLDILNYIILPHYRSDHPESADIEKDVERCKQLKIPFKTLKDGDVFYGEDIRTIKRVVELIR